MSDQYTTHLRNGLFHTCVSKQSDGTIPSPLPDSDALYWMRFIWELVIPFGKYLHEVLNTGQKHLPIYLLCNNKYGILSVLHSPSSYLKVTWVLNTVSYSQDHLLEVETSCGIEGRLAQYGPCEGGSWGGKVSYNMRRSGSLGNCELSWSPSPLPCLNGVNVVLMIKDRRLLKGEPGDGVKTESPEETWTDCRICRSREVDIST
jgi:hypothetical protein